MASLFHIAPLATPMPADSAALVDSYGRVHTDFRISVTDRCNIRCSYCMPEQGGEFAPISSLLTFPQIERVVRLATKLGVSKLRLTGGEPLLRPRLADLIGSLTRVNGLDDLALTTNGVLLASQAEILYAAGLRRLNVHLDTLDRGRFQQITRRDELPRVLAGIERAQAVGFRSIKINAVAVRGISEGDLLPLLQYGRERGISVRFIEFMPLDSQEIWARGNVLTADEMIARIEQEFGPLTPVRDADERAPATEYQMLDGFRVGFIASVSRPFCGNCNRLRLTSDGKLRNCLFAREETDIRPLLLRSDSEAELETALRTSVWKKWAGHQIDQFGFVPPQRPMYSIGG